MKKVISLLALGALLALSGTAVAEIGTIDDVPAATLLLPYFEVDLDNADGVTTLFSVNNASANSTVAHITIWTDWSVPVIDFDVYLTGFDVQSINLRDIIASGILPQTAVNNAISNHGPLSESQASAAARFGATCTTGTSTGQIPNYAPISSTFQSVIRAALTGQPIPAGSNQGLCAGADYGDNIARGYVTIDNATICSQDFPNDAGYFVAGGAGTANNDNVLWGDWFLVDSANNFAQGETLVHIEAAAGLTCDPATLSPATFYCRYSLGADEREALGNVHATRYLNGGAFTGGTDLLVWRDSGVSAASPVACNATPSWYPLSQAAIVAFDEEENVIEQQEGPSGFDPAAENPFVYETQRVSAGTDFTTPGDFGWVLLDLDAVTRGGVPSPEENQSWVTTVMDADGRFSVGFDAMQINNCTNFNTIPGTFPGPCL